MESETAEIGNSIGHYRILKKLGSGGMGEVFLAEDGRLRRKIALKVLPEDAASDKDRLRRFEQEAYSASALNHPNILTIYEFGATGETHFLAAEFVEGMTLRERMKRTRSLSIDETLEIAIQTAAALAAAHEAGIIHRDIKPENIMIRSDNLVKVLDFGLAKLTEKKAETSDAEAEIRAQVRTTPGMIMGTVAYMSPEQARGKDTDARSDIWSLGVVIYEMITGTPPFVGETTTDALAAIISKQPAPLSASVKNIPTQLEEIVGKCLEKNRDDRCQLMKDLLTDLRQLKKRLEFEAESGSSAEFNLADQRTTDPELEDKTQILNVTTGAAQVKPSTVSTAQYIAGELKRHKGMAFGVAALLVLTGIGLAIYNYSAFFRATANRFTSSENLKFTRLTSGQMQDLKISPDGKYIAYATTDGKVSIRLRQIATTTDVEIFAPAGGSVGGLSFTADGDYLYYVYRDSSTVFRSTIYRIPVLGGSPTKVVDKWDYAETAGSPDGKTLAYIGTDTSTKESYLLVSNADGSDERILSKLDGLSNLGRGLAWSPDGSMIAVCDATLDQGKSHVKLFGVSTGDGSRRQLSDQNWHRIWGIVWLTDGTLLISGEAESAKGMQAVPNQIWLIALNAAPRRITNDLNGFSRLSATAKGDVLLAMTIKQVGNLWVAPEADTARAVQVPNSGEVLFVNWTPDGNFVYTSRANDIWTMNADGTNQRQLTNNQGTNIHASMTGDGRYIVFVSTRAGGVDHIFRMDADGRNQKQWTSGLRELYPRLSPDGKWVYYVAFNGENEPYSICRISIEGGEPVIIAKVLADAPTFDISPRDGLIAHRQSTEGQEKSAGMISIIPPDGGEPIKTVMLPPTSAPIFHWTPDGRAIAFQDRRNGGANIWTHSLDGKGEAKPLTDFKTETISFSFAWSPDGKQLAVIRGTRVTDAVLITETK